MKILIAPDSFKGTNSSVQVIGRIEAGIRRVVPGAELVRIPIADGGEGTVEALVTGAGGEYFTERVAGPMGEPVDAVYGALPDGTAVIEMAAAAGLTLVPEGRRDPLAATTRGVGQLIRGAMDRGARRIVIGLGGSATNDCGAGMARALGASFKDASGRELAEGGGPLAGLAAVEIGGLDPRLRDTEILIASDVSSPLCGPAGASLVFGPQKGADGDTVALLDRSLAHTAEVVKAQLGLDFAEAPGAGAAGGLGYALLAFCGAKMKPGIETVMDTVGVDRHLASCDLVITGEGKIDAQSAFGKVPVGVARRAKKYGLPVLAIVGDIGAGAEAVYTYGIDSIMSTVNRAMPLSEALARGGELLEDAAERAMRMVMIGYGMRGKRG